MTAVHTSRKFHDPMRALEEALPIDVSNMTATYLTGLDDTKNADGFNQAVDCNDYDAQINPSMTKIPYNGIHENGNGMADDNPLMASTLRPITQDNWSLLYVDSEVLVQRTKFPLARKAVYAFDGEVNILNGTVAAMPCLTKSRST